MNSGGQLVFEWYSQGAFHTLTSTSANLGSRLGTFQQVAVTTDDSTVTFYVNGVAVGSSAMPVPLDITATGDLDIGGLANGPNLFDGLIDELSFTISPLPADVIAQIYANAGQGTDLGGSGTQDTTVAGNFIGTDPTGTTAIANGGDGVEIDSGASNNTIGATTAGAGNTIAFNTNDGVQVVGTGTTGNAIRGNSIFGNGVLGIELGTSGVPSTNVLGGSTSGPNDDENYPVLTIVSYTPGTGTTIAGNINTTPNTTVYVDLYTDAVEGQRGYGQGQTYIGSVTVNTTERRQRLVYLPEHVAPAQRDRHGDGDRPGKHVGVLARRCRRHARRSPRWSRGRARRALRQPPSTKARPSLRRLRLVQPRRRRALIHLGFQRRDSARDHHDPDRDARVRLRRDLRRHPDRQ